MNTLIENYYPLFELYQALRIQLMELLTDEDLAFQPGENTLTLGQLCRQIGETQYAYVQSFEDLTQDFSYRNQTPGLENSVAKLSAWFQELDGKMRAAIEKLSEEDIESKVVIDRGWAQLRPRTQLDIYKEALVIFYGKASIYLRLMGKPLPKQWVEWIE